MRTDDTPTTAARSSGAGAPLAEARTRREHLHAALVAVEEAIARPTGRPSDWAGRVHEALIELGSAFERHIATTEEPGGLFEAVNTAAPRLAGRVERLVREHQEIRTAIGQAIDAVRPQAHPFGQEDATGGRDVVLQLVNRLLRHRQTGADLVYEAFETDIGVGD